MQNEFDLIRSEALARLDRLFPDLLMVELGLAGPAVGVGRTTWHRHNQQGCAPFPATRIGNKRYVSIMDLATFVAKASTGEGGEGREAVEPLAADHQKIERRGRPTHSEVARAKKLGFSSVRAMRAAGGKEVAA